LAGNTLTLLWFWRSFSDRWAASVTAVGEWNYVCALLPRTIFFMVYGSQKKNIKCKSSTLATNTCAKIAPINTSLVTNRVCSFRRTAIQSTDATPSEQ
jgi:hypothetical protein